ncbi:hypothetical protein GIB67_018761 [Kingdonia uniflora]|nr:hypothetical protein GIB67_018761 [Kingdonia uniflora]
MRDSWQREEIEGRGKEYLRREVCLRVVQGREKGRDGKDGVYQLLGESGIYYGVRFGKNIPWVTEFPFGYIRDPQYVGSIMSLLACLPWVPFQYIFLWILGYVLMILVESKENSATRAKPIP